MTDVAVTIVPPEERTRRSGLADNGTHNDLFHALCADAVMAVHESGGGLSLAIPDGNTAARTFANELRETVLPASASVPIVAVRSEDGEPNSKATLSAMRDRSEAASVGILDSRVALIERTHLDTAAMRLRRDDVTIGPTPAGHWYFLGTSLPLERVPERIDHPVDGLARSVTGDDQSVGLLPILPVIDSQRTVAGTRAILTAMSIGKAGVAPYTTAWLESQ